VIPPPLWSDHSLCFRLFSPAEHRNLMHAFTKSLQLLETSSQTPTGAFPLDPTGGLPYPRSPDSLPHCINPNVCMNFSKVLVT